MGIYVCREKGTILMQTLGVQIKHIQGEDLTWGDADWARRDLGEAAATGARPWVSQREIPQLPSKSNQIEEFFIDESIVLDQNSRFGWILLWYRAGHTGRPAACRGRSRRRNGVLWEVFPHNRLDEDEDARVGLWARWFFHA